MNNGKDSFFFFLPKLAGIAPCLQKAELMAQQDAVNQIPSTMRARRDGGPDDHLGK